MNTIDSQRENISINLVNQRKKSLFDKKKNFEIVQNNNSLFLNKIQSLLEETLNNNNNSDMFNSLNTSTDLKNSYVNSEMEKPMIKNKTSFFNNNNLIIHLKAITPHNTIETGNLNFLSPKNNCCTKKILVNKNKNLGNFIKEKESINSPKIRNSNDNFKRILKHRMIKKVNSNNINLINTDLSLSSLYKNKIIRKPVIIKFENDFNINNIYNNSRIYNHSSKNSYKNIKIKSKEEYSNGGKTINVPNSELFRNYKDLEKKSLEISKRKLRKNSSNKINCFKKEIDLDDIKHSFEELKNSKSLDVSKNKDRKRKLIKFDYPQNNFSLNLDKNIKSKIFNNAKYNSPKQININNEQEIKSHNIENKNNYKEGSNNYNNFKAIKYNKSEINNNFENKKNKPIRMPKYNNIIFSYNNDNKSKKDKELENNANNDQKLKKIIQITNKENHRGNKTPIISKKFIEDHNKNEKNFLLSNNYSHSNISIPKNKNKKLIKTNIKNSPTSYNKDKKILPSILEEEEKIKKKNTNSKIIKLKIVKAFKLINKIFKSKNENILKEKFQKLFLYIKQKEKNNNTIQNIVSNFPGNKYTKKIITTNTKCRKENKSIEKCKNIYLKNDIINKNSIDVEKHKRIIIKRQKINAFERYENCKDFIDNLRINLIKYIFGRKKVI